MYTHPPIFADEVGTLDHTFDVVNRTGRPIHITRIVKSCSCTDAKLSKFELGPGEKTILSMTVKPQERNGVFGTEVALVHDGGDPWRFRFLIPVYNRVQFKPALLQLGAIKPQTPVEQNVTVYNYGIAAPPPLPKLSIAKGPESAEVILGESKVAQLPNAVWTRTTAVRFRMTPPKQGDGYCKIVLDSAAESVDLDTKLQVDWYFESPLQASPPRAFFAGVSASPSHVDCKIKVRRKDDLPFRITSLESSISAVTGECITRSRAEPEHEVVLTLEKGATEDFMYGELKIATDDESCEHLTIPIAVSR
ncbi:MAG: DUF1573 domain-containing protein [Pirellulales bacterium]